MKLASLEKRINDIEKRNSNDIEKRKGGLKICLMFALLIAFLALVLSTTMVLLLRNGEKELTIDELTNAFV